MGINRMITRVFIGYRQSGRTSEIVKFSVENDISILVKNRGCFDDVIEVYRTLQENGVVNKPLPAVIIVDSSLQGDVLEGQYMHTGSSRGIPTRFKKGTLVAIDDFDDWTEAEQCVIRDYFSVVAYSIISYSEKLPSADDGKYKRNKFFTWFKR